MKLVIEETEKEMSESAMQILLGAMLQDKKVNISLTSGKSPKMLYRMMIPFVKNKKKFADVEYWLFDEAPYVGEKEGQPGPNWSDMQDLFFREAKIPDERIHIPTMENYTVFDRMIRDAGGIDVMVIGLGYDGHFCSNCPHCTPMDSYTYAMDRKIKNALNPDYPQKPFNPYTLTMGPKSLMRVKHLVMIVNGREKAEIFKKFLEEPISDAIPSTVLRLHPNFTVIADREAASLINEDDYSNL